ncbi:hypothetical protein HMPREF3198_00035 [Winkia neuii]|nr:hypothetical protein HMPREF3198_00035 [Winkia neuii]
MALKTAENAATLGHLGVVLLVVAFPEAVARLSLVAISPHGVTQAVSW